MSDLQVYHKTHPSTEYDKAHPYVIQLRTGEKLSFTLEEYDRLWRSMRRLAGLFGTEPDKMPPKGKPIIWS